MSRWVPTPRSCSPRDTAAARDSFQQLPNCSRRASRSISRFIAPDGTRWDSADSSSCRTTVPAATPYGARHRRNRQWPPRRHRPTPPHAAAAPADPTTETTGVPRFPGSLDFTGRHSPSIRRTPYVALDGEALVVDPPLQFASALRACAGDGAGATAFASAPQSRPTAQDLSHFPAVKGRRRRRAIYVPRCAPREPCSPVLRPRGLRDSKIRSAAQSLRFERMLALGSCPTDRRPDQEPRAPRPGRSRPPAPARDGSPGR
jgi:hypothetical protein